MANGASRIIYMPVETRVREFDAKLLFSLHAVRAGFQAVIGPKWLFGVNYPRLPRGITVFKTLNLMDAPAIRIFKSIGHVAVAWDEEGADQIHTEHYLRNINDDAVADVDRIFSWGDHQTRLLAGKYPAAAAKIHTFGNPRWDMLRPEQRDFYRADTEALRARFGRFILINTNFSFFNSWFDNKIEGILKIATRTGAFSAENPADMAVLQDIFTFEKQMFQAYARLIPKLAAEFPDHKIILRPHPIEKPERWREHLPDLPNILVLHEGSVIPWIRAADVVLQTGCTTGFEALTVGTPTLSYVPYDSPVVSWHLSNVVCPLVTTDGDCIDRVRRYIANPAAFAPDHAAGMEKLSGYIARLSSETASAAIVGAIAELANHSEVSGRPLARAFPPDIAFEDYPRSDYLAMKFPPLDMAAFQDMKNALTRLSPELGNVAVTQLAESCFLLRRAD